MKEVDAREANNMGQKGKQNSHALYMSEVYALPKLIENSLALYDIDGLKEEVEELSLKTTMMQAGMGGAEKKYFSGETLPKFQIKEEQLKECQEVREKTQALVNKIKEKYTDPKSIQHRMAKLVENQIKLVYDESEYMNAYDMDPTYNSVFSAICTTFPEPMFVTGVDEKGKKVYGKDEKKYEQLMNGIGFLDLAEEKQKFVMQNTIPYIKAKKEGKITPEMVTDYRVRYEDHMKLQNEKAERILSIKNPEDKLGASPSEEEKKAFEERQQLAQLVNENKTFIDNTKGYELTWRDRCADVLIKKNAFTHKMLNHGWPVDDVSILMDVNDWERKRQFDANRPNATKEVKTLAKNVSKALNPVFEKNVVNSGDREKLFQIAQDAVTNLYPDDTRNMKERIQEASRKKIDPMEIGGSALERLAEMKGDVGAVAVQVDKSIKGSIKDQTYSYGLSRDDMKKSMSELVSSLNSVKSMWVHDSTQFQNMERDLKWLEEQGKQMENNEKGLIAFADKIEHVMGSVKSYLDHKQVQLDRDQSRKDSWKKSFHEQPRIQMAINLYEKLGNMAEQVEKTFTNARKDETQKAILASLDAEQKLRDEAKNMKDSDLRRSYTRSIDMLMKSQDIYYSRMKGESITHYAERIQNASKKSYTDEDLKEILKDPIVKDMVKDISTYMKNPNAVNGFENGITNATIKVNYEKHVKETVERIREANARQTQVNTYKEKMVSRKNEKQPVKNEMKK